MNIQALDKDNYQRSTNALHDPNQIQNILYQTDFQNVKNNQPNPYNNYMQNVKKQDELLKKMQNFHGGIISKEMALKKQQEDLINLNHLNRYNNDMAQVANQSQRKAVLNYKNGNKDENDPFLNFLKDQTMFPPTNQDIPIQNKIEDLNILNQLSQPLVSPNGPIRGPINSPINIQNNDIGSPLNLPIPNEINDLSQMHHFHNRSASTVSPKIPIINALSARKSSVISPHIKSLSHISPLHNPSVLNQQLQQPYQTPPNYSQPVVHVIPMPYPPQSDKRSNHSSREKSNKIPEEVRSMLTKQNEMLQNFIEKFEKNTSLEPNDNYSEKYEMKIKELEKNFDLTQEILNLKKQMYSFNAEKNNTANEEKKNSIEF